VPNIPEIKELILKEAHETPYSIHHFGVKGKLIPRYTGPFKILI
jgi:hypothetical protein